MFSPISTNQAVATASAASPGILVIEATIKKNVKGFHLQYCFDLQGAKLAVIILISDFRISSSVYAY